MNITNRPIYQKTGKPSKDPAYLNRVRELPCWCCGRFGPSEAHHCRDKPDYVDYAMYDSIPGAAMKSSDYDAIPLCPTCHWTFHNRRSEFHRLHGKDYLQLPAVRAELSSMELGF